MWFKSFALNIFFCVSVYGSITENSSLRKNCEYSYSPTCIKLGLASWVDKINQEDSYDIFPGVTIVRQGDSTNISTADIAHDLARDFPDDPDARLDAFLIRKLAEYVSNHEIRIASLEDEEETSRQMMKGGGGGGASSGWRYFLGAAAMLKGTLYGIALKMVAFLAGKALMMGMVSLVLSGVIGLKSLSQKEHSTYEVIAKPVYYEEVGHGGYRRSYESLTNNGLPIALQPGYTPK